MEEISAPGLKWIKRRASRTPIWVAGVKGYEPKTVNLSHLRDEPEQLVAKCALLQAEMNMWKAGLRDRDKSFDGTLKSILEKYQTEKDSPISLSGRILANRTTFISTGSSTKLAIDASIKLPAWI